MKPKVILDVDPGIDDTIAIICALFSQCLEVIGITTVKGNVDSKQGYLNVLHTIQLANKKNIPVIEGHNKWMDDKPLPPSIRSLQQQKHGRDGIGNQIINKKNTRFNNTGNEGEGEGIKKEYQGSLLKIDEFVKDNIVRRFQCKGEKVSIIATGPLTNIAKALENPSFAPSIEEISIMGGSFGFLTDNKGKEKSVQGIIEPAEFNFHCDPLAVKAIIDAKHGELRNTRISIAGLDVTQHQKAILNSKFIHNIEDNLDKNSNISKNGNTSSNSGSSIRGSRRNSPLITFVLSLLNFKATFNESFYLHDVVSLWMFEQPSSFIFNRGSINIHLNGKSRGQVEFMQTTDCNSSNNLRDFFIAREISDKNDFGNYLRDRIISIIRQSES